MNHKYDLPQHNDYTTHHNHETTKHSYDLAHHNYNTINHNNDLPEHNDYTTPARPRLKRGCDYKSVCNAKSNWRKNAARQFSHAPACR